MKLLHEVERRNNHMYRRVGSFQRKPEAERYKNEYPGSIIIVHNNPKQFGAEVIYHVFRQID